MMRRADSAISDRQSVLAVPTKISSAIPGFDAQPSQLVRGQPNMPKFVPRQRKHKVIARQKSRPDIEQDDANTTEILPQEERARADKKEALKSQLMSEAQGKMSGKKKKRLDKYIVRLSRQLSEASHLACHRLALKDFSNDPYWKQLTSGSSRIRSSRKRRISSF
jgi:ATP-dependent RNA helicase DHX37/DHR1